MLPRLHARVRAGVAYELVLIYEQADLPREDVEPFLRRIVVVDRDALGSGRRIPLK
jgi:hypothetical protein